MQEKSVELNEEKSELFHSIVAKLLYERKRARPDVETVVAYICTRVSKSTEDDWVKLRRLLGFIKHTINDIRIIGANSLQKIYTWVNASYDVHEDLKIHIGGAMSMGTGLLYQRSSKQ